MIHSIEIKVRGYHLDLFGHVNNARYLEFLEEARWDLLEKIPDFKLLVGERYSFTVVNININYRLPALMGHVLVIESELTQIGRHSAVIHQAITRKGTDDLVADADITFVVIDTQTRKAALMEGAVLEILKKI